MPERFQAPRGVADVLPEEQPYWRWLRDTAARVAESYGYSQIETPVFEHAGVFLRPGSEGTDLVDKEVYRFLDRAGDDLALRPEGTAGVVRAYVDHGMASRPQPVRLFYFIDVFRYDRPQAGRYRVHHQFGVEAIGDGDPYVDAEVIDLLRTFYDALGLRGMRLALNSIGDAACRPAYLEKLRDYYRPHLDEMCGDCRRRFDVNPLRLLDCKNDPCQPFKAAAPRTIDNLCDACAEHFATLRSLLDALELLYDIDPALVRGIDYYTRTAFEFLPTDDAGQQSTIGAGGRYDGLVEQLGGRPTPGIGFGTGLERLILNLKRQGLEPPATLDGRVVFIASAQPELQGRSLRFARDIRAQGDRALLGNATRSLRSQLRSANASGAQYALILGSEEVATNTVTLRNLITSEQVRLPFAEAMLRIRQASPPPGASEP